MNRDLIYFYEQERRSVWEMLEKEKQKSQHLLSRPGGVYFLEEQLEQKYITQLAGLSMKQLHTLLEENATALKKKKSQRGSLDKVEKDDLIRYRLYILHVYYDRILSKLDRILKYLHSREIIDYYLMSMATRRMEFPQADISTIQVSHNHKFIPALDFITQLIRSNEQTRQGSVGSDERRRKRRR